jgi:hypothetical protein
MIYITAALMTTNGANSVTSSVVEMQYQSNKNLIFKKNAKI